MTRSEIISSIKENPSFIRKISIKDQTEDLCLLAVRQQGTAIRHIHNQTPKICLAAIKQNPLVLGFIKNKSYSVCIANLMRTPHALYYLNKVYNEKTNDI